MLIHARADGRLPMRTAVLGAGGFVGGAIARAVTDGGGAVTRLGRPEIDLLAPDAVKRLADRLADAEALVVVSAIAPSKTLATTIDNLRMAQAVLAALAQRAVSHVIYMSSDAVYADDASPVNETSPVQPSSPHGMMHAARELFFRQAIAREKLCILRPSLLYGAADPHNGYGPNRFRRQAATGEPIALFGEGEEQRDHVHIADVARLVRLCLERRSYGVLNIATGRSVSFRRVAELTAEACGGKATIQGAPRGGPVTHRHFDVTALHKAFPGLSLTPPERGIAQVVSEEAGRG